MSNGITTGSRVPININHREETRPIIVAGNRDSGISDTEPIKLVQAQPLATTHPGRGKYQLGKLVTVYRKNRLSAFGWIVLVMTGTGLTILSISLAGWQYWQFGISFGLAAAVQHSSFWLILSGLLLVAFTSLFIHKLRTSICFINLYENGVRYKTGFFRSGTFFYNQVKSLRMDPVREKFLGLTIRKRHTVWITRIDEKQIKFGSEFFQIDGFIHCLATRCYPYIKKRLDEQFNLDQWLDFGMVHVNRSLIRIKDKTISTSHIDSIVVIKGKLQILTKITRPGKTDETKELQIPTNDIENLDLLFDFIQVGITQ